VEQVGIAPFEVTAGETIGLVRDAEAAGFESAWISDPHGYLRVAALSQKTERIRLGTAVVVQPLMNPVAHADMIADLAELSGGRAMVGLGAGVKPQLNRFFGIVGDQAEHPAPRIREFVELLRELTGTTDRVQWDGRFFRLQGARGHPPAHPVPIYLAAVNRLSLRVAGDLADGLIGHPINSVQYLRETIVPTIEERLEAGGRSRESFSITSDVVTSIHEDHAIARRDAAITLGYYLTPRAFDCIFDAGGWEAEKTQVRDAFRTGELENVAEAVTDRMLESCCLVGTPAEVRDQAERYEGLLDRLIFYSPIHAVPRDRHVENYRRIFATFAR
jgi:alkanesulfonate monooxygenase SsuD/methylene tetrahydromethanopterin reductase-like flavin-dependent oxidoreductase (luciferase family)